MVRSSLSCARQDIKQSPIGLRRHGAPTEWYTMGAGVSDFFHLSWHNNSLYHRTPRHSPRTFPLGSLPPCRLHRICLLSLWYTYCEEKKSWCSDIVCYCFVWSDLGAAKPSSRHRAKPKNKEHESTNASKFHVEPPRGEKREAKGVK